MQKQEEELKTLLVTELLKAKEQEVNAAQAEKVTAVNRYTKCKHRLRDALLKQEDLQAELNKLRVETGEAGGDHPPSAKYKQRALNAKAACQAALDECEKLKGQLAESKTVFDSRTSEFKNSIETYKLNVKNAKADHEQAESNCQRLQLELEAARKECEALRSKLAGNAASQSHSQSISEIQRETNDKISSALDCLPAVENHPSWDLKPIGSNLKETIAHLPKEVRASIEGSRRRTFLETHVIFTGNNQQHGYILCPQMAVKRANRFGVEHWITNKIPTRYHDTFEVFYRRGGMWYYIGTYKGFLVSDAPWETFSRWPDEVVTGLINTTIIGSPRGKADSSMFQRVLELYRNGEVVGCYTGLQCVGFSDSLYQHLCRASEATEKNIRPDGEETITHAKRPREVDATRSADPHKKQKMDL